MANIYHGCLDTLGEMVDLESALSISFTDGTSYTIQVIGPATVGTSNEGGIVLPDDKPFTFNCDGGTLYLKSNGIVSIDIED